MPGDEHTHDEPTGPTTPPPATDAALIQQLLTMIQESNESQLRGLRTIMKWQVGLTVICLVTIVALAGADMVVKTGWLDVSTKSTATASEGAAWMGPVVDTGWMRLEEPDPGPVEPTP